MSGSSLDGLDIAYCSFEVEKTALDLKVLDWKLIAATTKPFSEKWQHRLSQLPEQSALAFAKTHTYLGHYFGELVNDFIAEHSIEPDFIASHGHTIFHDPAGRMTIQIGDGAALAATTGFPVISNFRNQDVAIDGEGAPIAPIADKYLLSDNDFYLNIGGIANITCSLEDRMVAFDICPANQLLNSIASLIGMEYDDGGQVAATGKVIIELLESLNELNFYKEDYPKSLDNAWSRTAILSKIDVEMYAMPDLLTTFSEHIAIQIATAIQRIIDKEQFFKKNYSLLPTGGGTFNTYLMERIKANCEARLNIKIVLPTTNILQFKEAILMAWMGVMRLENTPNVLHTVTGARRNSINGAIHQGWKKMLG